MTVELLVARFSVATDCGITRKKIGSKRLDCGLLGYDVVIHHGEAVPWLTAVGVKTHGWMVK